MFSTHPKTYFNFSIAFNLLSANAFNLDQSKILLFGKKLILKSHLICCLQSIEFESVWNL